MIRRFAVCVGVLGMLALSSVAGAQDRPRVNVAGGYSFLHDFDASRNFSAGWFGSLGGNINNWLGVAGEISGNYKTVDIPTLNSLQGPVDLTVHAFLAGPKFTLRQRGLTFYGQTLFGATRSASRGQISGHFSETNFSFQPGGGVELGLAKNLGVRLGLNYQIIHAPHCCLSHIGNNSNELQFVAGVVFPSASFIH